MSHDFTFEVDQEETAAGVTVSIIRIDGKIGSTTVRRIEDLVDDLLKEGRLHLIFDCSAVEYLNSTGAGLLIKVMDQVAQKGGSVRLASLGPEVRSTLDILGLVDVFQIMETVEEALREP